MKSDVNIVISNDNPTLTILEGEAPIVNNPQAFKTANLDQYIFTEQLNKGLIESTGKSILYIEFLKLRTQIEVACLFTYWVEPENRLARTYHGSLRLPEIFEKLHNNTFSLRKLIHVVRTYSDYFPDSDDLLEVLNNLRMEIIKLNKKADDERANTEIEIKKQVQTNLPNTVNVLANWWDGADIMPWELKYNVNEGDEIEIWFESSTLMQKIAEKIDEYISNLQATIPLGENGCYQLLLCNR